MVLVFLFFRPHLAKQDLWLLVLSPAWSLPPIISRPPLEPISLLLVAGIHKAHRSEDQRIRVTESMVFKVHVAWTSKVWLYHLGWEYVLAREQNNALRWSASTTRVVLFDPHLRFIFLVNWIWAFHSLSLFPPRKITFPSVFTWEIIKSEVEWWKVISPSELVFETFLSNLSCWDRVQLFR